MLAIYVTFTMLNIATCLIHRGNINIIPIEKLQRNGIDRVLAIPDIHGDYDNLLEIAKRYSICDNSSKWIGKNLIVVFIGDYVHRGPQSVEVMEQIIKWEQEAQDPKFNSLILTLRGNHEQFEIVYPHRNVLYKDDIDVVACLEQSAEHESFKFDQRNIFLPDTK
eukprot:554332_1